MLEEVFEGQMGEESKERLSLAGLSLAIKFACAVQPGPVGLALHSGPVYIAVP